MLFIVCIEVDINEKWKILVKKKKSGWVGFSSVFWFLIVLMWHYHVTYHDFFFSFSSKIHLCWLADFCPYQLHIQGFRIEITVKFLSFYFFLNQNLALFINVYLKMLNKIGLLKTCLQTYVCSLIWGARVFLQLQIHLIVLLIIQIFFPVGLLWKLILECLAKIKVHCHPLSPAPCLLTLC